MLLLQTLSDLPAQMTERVLIKTFLMLYMFDKSRSAERQAFTILASVCSQWYWTLTGWPESPTGQRVKNRLRKLIKRECLTSMLTQLDLQ